MRYVTVDEISGKVVNVGQVTSLNALDEPPIAHRHIGENDWITGSDPAIGDEWDGQSPTSFTRPSNELSDLSATELLDKMAEQREQLAATEAALREKLV